MLPHHATTMYEIYVRLLNYTCEFSVKYIIFIMFMNLPADLNVLVCIRKNMPNNLGEKGGDPDTI